MEKAAIPSLIKKNSTLTLEIMENVIKLLREQTILCRRTLELFAKLIELLEQNSPDLSESVLKIEKILTDLRKNSAQSQKFLQAQNCGNFADFLERQEKSIQSDVAKRLLAQSEILQSQLKRKINSAQLLTEKGAVFVNFNLNLLSQTSAGTTYGEQTLSSQSKLQMIDANI